MVRKSSWSRSDVIAVVALLAAAAGLLFQYLDRSLPYKVQVYIDKTQAASKIIESVEQLINARQIAMISVKGNIYDPHWAKQQPLERLNSDAKEATVVLHALGNYNATIQNNIRHFQQERTVIALMELDRQVDLAVRCFTDVASVRHEVNPEQLKQFQETIAASCNGANRPGSLTALKAAEAAAMREMDAERTAGAT